MSETETTRFVISNDDFAKVVSIMEALDVCQSSRFTTLEMETSITKELIPRLNWKNYTGNQAEAFDLEDMTYDEVIMELEAEIQKTTPLEPVVEESSDVS